MAFNCCSQTTNTTLSLGRKCGSINPLLVVSQMRAQFVQKQK